MEIGKRQIGKIGHYEKLYLLTKKGKWEIGGKINQANGKS